MVNNNCSLSVTILKCLKPRFSINTKAKNQTDSQTHFPSLDCSTAHRLIWIPLAAQFFHAMTPGTSGNTNEGHVHLHFSAVFESRITALLGLGATNCFNSSKPSIALVLYKGNTCLPTTRDSFTRWNFTVIIERRKHSVLLPVTVSKIKRNISVC